MDELAQQPTRRRILDHVRERPGISGREVQRQVGLGWGETAYHLERLVRGGLLRRERGAGRDYYFTSDVTWEDRRLFETLRSPTGRQIALFLVRTPGLTFADLQAALGVGKSTVSYHLTRLAERQAVESYFEGGLRRYRLLRPDRVGQLLRSYHTTFGDELVDRFAESLSALLGE